MKNVGDAEPAESTASDFLLTSANQRLQRALTGAVLPHVLACIVFADVMLPCVVAVCLQFFCMQVRMKAAPPNARDHRRRGKGVP